MTETDLGKIAEKISGLEVSSPEHPEDRRQRHRKENVALRLIIGAASVAGLILIDQCVSARSPAADGLGRGDHAGGDRWGRRLRPEVIPWERPPQGWAVDGAKEALPGWAWETRPNNLPVAPTQGRAANLSTVAITKAGSR